MSKTILDSNQLSLFQEPETIPKWDSLWKCYDFPEPQIGDIIAIGSCTAELIEPEDPEHPRLYLYWQLCSIFEIREDGMVVCKFNFDFSPDNQWIYENILGMKVLLSKEDVCIPFPQVHFLLDLHEKCEITIRDEYREAMLGWQNASAE